MPLRLAAFLGQPILAYGHHQDCAAGFGRLAEIASVVNSWGQTNWTNLEMILRGNYRTTRDSELMHVQMCSRNVCVLIPENISHVVVHVQVGRETAQRRIVATSSDGQTQECTPGIPFGIAAPGDLQLTIPRRHVIDPAAVNPPANRLWPPVRRALSMSRDRLMPIVRTFQLSGEVQSHARQD
jgi:hypothetical protein